MIGKSSLEKRAGFFQTLFLADILGIIDFLNIFLYSALVLFIAPVICFGIWMNLLIEN